MAKLVQEIPNLSDLQATIEVMKLMARMGVGHTEALPPHALEFAQTLPLKFFLFKEGLYIVAADPKYRDLLGAQVIGFGDASVTQVLTAVNPVIFKDNEMWLKAMGPNLLRYTALLKGLNLTSELSSVPLTVFDSRGQTRTTMVAADTSYPDIWNIFPFPSTWIGFSATKTGPMPLYLKNMDKFYLFEYLPESRTVYFQYNRVLPDAKEPFDEFVARLFSFIDQHEVNRLIIDLRWNNGGNTYLLPPLIHSLVGAAKVNWTAPIFCHKRY